MTTRDFRLVFLLHAVSDSLRRSDGRRADVYWEPLNQVEWELECILRESGFVDALPEKLARILILTCYEDRYAFDASESGFENKKQFEIYVHLDAREFWRSPPHEERYWPLMRVCLEGLCDAARVFTMPSVVIARLGGALAALPNSKPWPPLPPFDPRDAERFDESLKTAQPLIGSDGRTRVVKALDRGEGVLWIMCGPVAKESDAEVDRLHQDLRELIAEKRLGQWDGDSRSGYVSDISFQVPSLSRAAKAVDGFLRKAWPSLDFVIGDEYDPEAFEQVR